MPIAAGIVGDARHAAVVASLDVAAERRGAARHDRAHHAPLDAPQMSGMGAAIGLAMPAQDIGDLDGGPCGRTPGRAITRIPARRHPGGVTSSDRRSSGLCVARIVWVATCV